MKFQVVEIIRKKRGGETLSEAELAFLVRGYVDGQIKDYQMAAFLMAVFFRGMAPQEMQTWAHLMWHSGSTFPRVSRKDFWIDKHSTGGVGDKTSMILVPLVHCVSERLLGKGAAKIPMISGRGLDFTGGTLDKMDSIPGFSSQLPLERAMALLEKNGFFMGGQTQDIAPADRLLYALRDVTATVECVPLIVSSILSKKLAENLDGLAFDVKFGSGAFMGNLESAQLLAKALAEVARAEGVAATAVLTAMHEPLGWKVGNQLEMEECSDYLFGVTREPGLHHVTVALAAEMIALASRGKVSPAAAKAECEKELAGTQAHVVFVSLFEQQGGDWAAFERQRLALDKRRRIGYRAQADGYLARLDARWIGQLVKQIGGGRETKESGIDLNVGVVLHRKVGDRVKMGDVLFEMILSDEKQAETIPSPGEFVRVESNPVASPPWIHEVLRA